ncbi:MAG: glycine cleavage system protein R [bacterium]
MSINKSLVMTVLGEDRPGLVEELSSAITQHQGNWLGSHLSSMAGLFGGMVHVLVPTDRVDPLISALRRLEPAGLSVSVMTGLPEGTDDTLQEAELQVMGNDRPGIVSSISQAIASHGINVEELKTEYSTAPMSGTAMFKAQARLFLPASASPKELRRELEQIASDLMVDIDLA